MSKKEFIEKLFVKRATYNDPEQAEMTANLLDTVSSDIYSESQRFVFELIQNADDAARGEGNEVRFDFFDHHLLVSHNGSAFTPEDIEAITGAGFSRKKNDPTKTGYKGIGFKSVFGKSDWVGIFSDGYHLRFEKEYHTARLPWQVIPIWTEANTLPAEVQSFIESNGYHVTTVIQLVAASVLEQELTELLQNGQILLFLRHVNAITVARQGQQQYTISKTVEPATAAYQPTTLWKDGNSTSSWLVQSFDQLMVDADTQKALQADEKTPAKLRDASHTELAFAARVESGRIRALSAEESLLFTYLPTKVADFGFPFLVNGSFLTSAAREALHEDRVWNQWLMGLVADNLFSWLAQLAQSEHRFEVLHLLPKLFPGSNNELKKAFAVKAKQALANYAFIPTQSQTEARVADVVIDDTGLASQAFISKENLVKFINAKTSGSFSSSSFAHADLQLARKLQPLGATLFEASNLESYFLSDTFADSHQLNQNYSLLEYFFRKATKYDTTGEWNHKLKLIPFIYSADQELKAPATICFPSLAYKTDAGQTVTVLHPDVYAKVSQHTDLKSWLESLGVKEPSDEAYLENEIIGNISKCITRDNYQQVTRYLFSQYKKGKITPTHLEKLQDIRLMCTNGVLHAAKDCYLADSYEPILKLQEKNKKGDFVAEYKESDDLVSEWKTFFLKIGVSENISLAHGGCKRGLTKGIELEYFDFIGEEVKKGHPYPHLVGPENLVHIDKIRYSQFANDYQFSKLFWEQVFVNIDLDEINKFGKMPWGYYGSINAVINYFHWFLDNRPVFPTSQKTCRKAAEVFSNHKDIVDLAGSHLPVFDYDAPIPEAWKPLLKFRQKLEVDDYLKVLASIAKTAIERDGKVSDAERKRIGLVYNQLAERLPDFSSTERAALFTWSGANSLLSANDSFEPATELKWITAEGFQTLPGSSIKALYIPKNCQTSSAEFTQLLELLQVQCIKEFTPLIEGEKPNPTLKNKLLQTLPYLALVVHKRQYKSAEAEFNRMRKLVEATSFYSATAICLSFVYRGETVAGQPLPVLRGADSSFYLKGDWRSPRTAYQLLRELDSLLGVKHVDNELRLLLELPIAEAAQWLLEDIGVAGADLAAAQNWSSVSEVILDSSAVPSLISAAAEPLSRVDDNGFEELSTGVDWADTPFEPTISADAINPAAVSVSRHLSSIPIATAPPSSYSTIANLDTRLDVGRWCEELVYKLLCADSTEFTQVQWVNQHAESRLPYDFQVVQNGQTRFLEVKGTPSRTKDSIYLSQAEWKVMFDQGAQYSIYRVLGAGNTDPRVIVTDHPSSQIQQGLLLPNPIELII
ncbi:sacsin N-terminal ATP-binding-like domain-containing protein [Hymenobacter psychrophilus]|uniref:Histidine kinase-, DNA gyrase B-, and HSP90-like ATPase n=1 Tax=Hymenobacter psychrophilus TaxID=651662 RepID=A0A1H3IRK8_9BACT|nr:DUF3883 domain-containing protein [Hymenobacter psychrophilus]SDY29945.1 Histidine kinase-, DNA gyrase B-, and HSP90-like ATPase [Hymenobacter psychrophilus]